MWLSCVDLLVSNYAKVEQHDLNLSVQATASKFNDNFRATPGQNLVCLI